MISLSPSYLFNSVLRINISCSNRSPKNTFFSWTLFFPIVIKERNRIDKNIRNADNINSKKILLNFVRFLIPNSPFLIPNNIPNFHNSQELNILTRLQLYLIHLCHEKFNHDILDIINSFCSCGYDIETTSHFSSPVKVIRKKELTWVKFPKLIVTCLHELIIIHSKLFCLTTFYLINSIAIDEMYKICIKNRFNEKMSWHYFLIFCSDVWENGQQTAWVMSFWALFWF